MFSIMRVSQRLGLKSITKHNNKRKTTRSIKKRRTNQFQTVKNFSSIKRFYAIASPSSAPREENDNLYAFHSVTWLSLVADIAATEAEVPANQVSPSHLKSIYVSQLNEFNKKVEDLRKEGVSEGAINSLRKIFQIRSEMPESDILRVLQNLKVSKISKSSQPLGKVLPRNINKKHLSNLVKDITSNKSLSRGQKMDLVKKEVVTPTNEPYNKNLLYGIVGFIQAFNEGFNPKQIQDIKSILSTSASGDVSVYKYKNQVEGDLQKKNENVGLLLSQGKVDQLYPMPADLPSEYVPEYTSWVQKVKSVFSSPKVKDIDVINLIYKAKPTQEQLNKILDSFATKNTTQQMDKINERLQIENTLGDTLWGTYIPALSRDILVYTQHYSESPKPRLTEINSENIDGLGMKITDIIRKGEIEPNKKNSASEDIVTLRLERLANFYGLDLENENDLIRFNAFMNEFDVSPGERTLDFCHDALPPEHTYEEIPIMKLPSGEKMEDHLGL